MRFYKEIPFIDCPEAVYVESVTRERGTLNCEEYKKVRPFMLMLDPDGVATIKKNWKQNCRTAGDACNVQLDSVSGVIDHLDQLSRLIIKP